MSKRFIIILAFCAVLLSACSVDTNLGINTLKGSGKYATRDYAVTGFTGIDACCGFQVTVTGGDTYKVSVTADDNILEAVVVEKQGDSVRIGFDTKKFPSISSTRLEAQVTLPELKSVNVSGGSQLSITGTSPKGSTLSVEASGGSKALLGSLSAQSANVNLSGGSQATVNVSGSLSYDLSGGAQLKYSGNPTIGHAATSGGASAGPGN